MDYKRFVAERVWIADLHSSTYRASESLVELEDGRSASRVCCTGIVVGTDDSVWIDDGTGTMAVRSFDNASVEIGKVAIVIGRPREFESQKYLLGEIVKEIDQRWFDVWRKQVPRVVPSTTEEPVEVEGDDAIDVVRGLDSGEGADYDEVVSKVGEDKVVHLLAVGELFETKPGRLKVLE